MDRLLTLLIPLRRRLRLRDGWLLAQRTLPFALLADEDHQVCELYGAWGRKKFMGREYDGVLRSTFVISADGEIKKVFENVKPAGHSAEVLAAVKG